jgi:hypothetical protein
MALQTGIIKVRGKIGDKVGFNRNGKPRLRDQAQNVQRSDATKDAATDFGTASKAGKLIRRAVRQGLNIRTDNGITNRMNTRLMKVLYVSSDERGNRQFKREEMAALTGFKFNKNTELGQLLNFRPKVVQDKKHLRIALPALTAEDILHAKNTTHIEIKAIAVGVNFNEGTYQDALTDQVMIDFRKPAAAKELILPFKAGEDETIVTLQITAYSEENGKMYKRDNVKYFAADIIDVIPSLPQEEEAGIVHHSRDQKKPLFQLHGDHTCLAPQKE